jgi:toxin ParE1/3/4
LAVIWRAAALADVGGIIAYVAVENPVAARRIGRDLLAAGDSLAIFPRRGRPGRVAGTRELAIVSPYVIVYRVTGADDVTIVRIWHGAQDRR